MRATQKLKDWRSYNRLLLKPKLMDAAYETRIISSSEELMQAKRLHASIYIARGFIAMSDIDSNGTMLVQADPSQVHSDYFGVFAHSQDPSVADDLVSLARQIIPHHNRGISSLPIMQMAQLYPHEQAKILKYSPHRTVEISALVKKREINSIAPLYLYRKLFQHSLTQQHNYWLMACDTRLYSRLKLLFGAAVVQIGDVTPYFGGDVVPAKVNIHEAIGILHSEAQRGNIIHRRLRRSVLDFFIHGLDQKFQDRYSTGSSKKGRTK